MMSSRDGEYLEEALTKKVQGNSAFSDSIPDFDLLNGNHRFWRAAESAPKKV